MSLNYLMEGPHIVDYDLYAIPGIEFVLRGPQWPLASESPAISFLGAAQTFGAFVKYPFANLVGDMVSARVVNLGRGGAGPGFYARHAAVLDVVNATNLCVVQVMSARSSIETSYMKSVDGLASVTILRGERAGQVMLGHNAFQVLAKELPPEEFLALIAETREGFVRQFADLAARIRVPKILLHVGRNPPLPDTVDPARGKTDQLVGLHPHMVTEGMVAEIGKHFDAVVVSVGSVGADVPLMNRITGRYTSVTRSPTYTIRQHDAYISPYLHTRAALDLYEPVTRLLPKRGRART